MDLQSLFSIISCSVLVLIGTGIAILASFRVHKANQIFCAGLFELDPSLAEFLRLVFEYIVLGIAMGMIAYGGVELTARANPERWIEGGVLRSYNKHLGRFTSADREQL